MKYISSYDKLDQLREWAGLGFLVRRLGSRSFIFIFIFGFMVLWLSQDSVLEGIELFWLMDSHTHEGLYCEPRKSYCFSGSDDEYSMARLSGWI